jgi:hypothetical protein
MIPLAAAPGTTASRLPPEYRFLIELLASSRPLDQAQGTEDRRDQSIDWSRVLQAADRHGLRPLVAWRVDLETPSVVPPSVRSELKTSFERQAIHNLRSTAELLRILASFSQRGIRAAPFKGPALAAQLYGNIALRRFADLDILVHVDDVAAAVDSLRQVGYVPQVTLTQNQDLAYLASIGQLPMTRAETGDYVELHTRFAPRGFHFPIESEDFWKRLTPISICGHRVLGLSSEENLLVLAVHGGKHQWTSLAWINDIHQLLRVHPGMDWPWLEAAARKFRCERLLRLALLLAQHVLETPLPEDVRRWLSADAVARRLMEQVLGRLFRNAEPSVSGWESVKFFVMAREHVRDGLTYALTLAFAPTSADWAIVRLPRPLFALYYLVRMVRLGLRGLSGRKS